MSRRARTVALCGLVAAIAVACAPPAGVMAEPASRPASAASAGLDVGKYHACAVLASGGVRCWGYGGDGALGYGALDTIGDNETPAAAGPVNLGVIQNAVALSAGAVHTCAVLVGGSVRCWGYGGNGRLGYGTQDSVGDNEPPGAAGPVNLGPGRTAKAIAAGRSHTCAVLDDGNVRCWGFGFDGRLGYGDVDAIGDDELPPATGPVKLGAGRTATAITVGDSHSCALLDDGTVRCWGYAGNGQLGYGNTTTFSETQTPDTAGPVQLGSGRTAVALSAGSFHTCALLDDGTARCWGFGGSGRLGYGKEDAVGDDETPASIAPVNLGAGRTAVAISAGADHTCAVLDDGSVRCWGAGRAGQLGYSNTVSIGDNETPGSAGPVNLGPGRTALAIGAGDVSTCARLDDGSVLCWGEGVTGVLGYCRTDPIGDNELPSVLGPLDLGDPGIAGYPCDTSPPPGGQAPGAGTVPRPVVPGPPPSAPDDGLAAQARRAKAWRDCRAAVGRRTAAQRRRTRSLPARARAAEIRRIERRATQARRSCLIRHARVPGRVASLTAKASGSRTITLTFNAPGTDGSKPPAARSYLVKQSLRPIRTARDFRRAHALCKGACTFDVIQRDAPIKLEVTDLLGRRAYHYAVAARDNVTALTGSRSETATARTR